jgi:glycosyltransferase involved in cell wall biosynthesis
MNVLFVHNEFPGQFMHLATHLARQRGHNVVAIGGPNSRELDQIALRRYQLTRDSTPGILPYAETYEIECLHGEAAAVSAAELAREGFRPDVIIGHAGWGELLYLKEIWPNTKTVAYAEYYYRGRGGDSSFDLEIDDPGLAYLIFSRAKNAGVAICVAEADLVICPTNWQRSCYPESLRSRIIVAHDGIDTVGIRPLPDARLKLAGSDQEFRAGDEVVTYVNRALEPMRGIHVFLRALPAILESRPSAHVLIVGSEDERLYGKWPPEEATWKDIFVREVRDRIDPARVHWLGLLDRPALNNFFGVSRVHVYLTYPFVLSWSMLEAMSAGCLVVASSTPPVEEVIKSGHNGLTVDFFDHQALAGTVIDALGRPREAFSTITAAARDTIVKRYDRDAVCLPRLVGLIESLATR